MNDTESSLSQLAFQLNEQKKKSDELSADKVDKSKLDPDTEINNIRSVIDRLAQLKDVLTPNQLKDLLDPCIVLVMAGMKPTSILFGNQLTDLPEDIQSKLGVKVKTGIVSTQSPDKLFSKSALLRSIVGENLDLSGAKDVTRVEDILLDKLYVRFPGSENQELREIITEGILLGYPDTAILDFAIAYRKNFLSRSTAHVDELISSQTIEYNEDLHYLTNHYAAPDFYFHPSHINSPDISSCIDAMNNIFKAFYNDPTITELCRELGIVKS